MRKSFKLANNLKRVTNEHVRNVLGEHFVTATSDELVVVSLVVLQRCDWIVFKASNKSSNEYHYRVRYMVSRCSSRWSRSAIC